MSSSLLLSPPFWVPVESVGVRFMRVGPDFSPFLLAATTVCKRAFTSLNSEVVTMYSSRLGSISLISSIDFTMRSGVGG